MKAYSQDLRQRILQTVDEGKTQAQAACLLKVSETIAFANSLRMWLYQLMTLLANETGGAIVPTRAAAKATPTI